MIIEDTIQELSQQNISPAFCWLICFEKRPFQGIPPGGSGPHLMAFSNENSAQAFIAGRGKYYRNEPLSVIKIDSAETLKYLLIEPCRDPRYAAPPCGLVLDFDYATGKAKRVISPADASKIEESEIAQLFLAPPITVRNQRTPWSKSAKMIAGIIGGAAGIIVLVLVGVGVVSGMKSGKIPAFAFLNTPTLTPTPTQTPTPLPTFTPTAQPWQIHYTDAFVTNQWGWPQKMNTVFEGCGTESMYIDSNSLIWKIDASSSCTWSEYPSFAQMKEFDYSLDAKQVPNSSNGDNGLAFSSTDFSYQLYFRVDSYNSTFVVESLQSDWKTIIPWTHSSAINGTGVNRLRMLKKDNIFTFYVNGVEVGSANISAISSGIIGVSMGAYNAGDSVSNSFDNLELFTNR
jgi:hypothetical protein